MRLTENEKRTVLAVFGELRKLRYDDLNRIIGSATIKEMQTLCSKLEHEDYCERNGIRFEDMTADDFENAALEKIDEYNSCC